MIDSFTSLEFGVYAALETYSNVHRGSGLNSMVSTHLFEEARSIILEFLGLKKGKYIVIFCTPRRASVLMAQLDQRSYHLMASSDIGLSLGVKAFVVNRKTLPGGPPFQTGGGTTRVVSKGWVIWADAPDKFEAGTPAIVNVIAFARALGLIRKYGNDIFRNPTGETLTASEILYRDELEKYSGQELLDELRLTLIGRGILVPTVEGERPFINLDNSASTPTFSPIWNTVRQTWRQPGQVQQEIIHEVRSICEGMLGAPLTDYDVIFTSNTTEAINLAAESLARESNPDIDSVVLNTLLEHSSNELPWRIIPNMSLIRLDVDAEGFLEPDELEKVLSAYNQHGRNGKRRIKLVAVSGASNVLGVCNNLGEISRIVHQYGAKLLVDAAQLVAHRSVGMQECGIDYLAFSAHKVYAPFGTGVLVARKGILNFSFAELELIKSFGEENSAGIAALGKALVLLQRIGFDLIQEEEQALTRRALRGLSQIPGLTIYGITDPDSPGFSRKIGVIVFALKGMMSDRVAKELSIQGGIGVRYGCHCAHIIIKHMLNISPLLERFQGMIVTLFPKISLPGLVRVSLGIENSEEDVDKLIHVVDKIGRKPSSPMQRHSGASTIVTPGLLKSDVQKKINDFIRSSALKVYSGY
ncbi:MAG: aminotransferase class V-fold PLP-dependent enzyme [Bacteroidales bacterium]|nr:aminotransferase class V-fold PLP-dependent enzyme [Bacteroidales bacterium]